jgi:hypothetical protein
MIDTIFRFEIQILYLDIDYLSLKMILSEKGLNYKVVDLNEIYSFHIKLISIPVRTKKNYVFLKMY